jgi:hypothetical protein
MRHAPITSVTLPVSMKFLLFAALLLFALAPTYAMAQSCATRPPDAKVIVKLKVQELEISEDRNFNELKRMFKKPGMHPAGLYTGGIMTEQGVNYRWTSNGREICVSVNTVEVTLTLKEPKMFVGRELADNTCARQSVWEHEIVHYRIDQDVLQRHVPIIQRAVEFATRQIRGVAVSRESDVERVGERMARTNRQTQARVSNDLRSDRDSMHERLDSREEYARTAVACEDGHLGISRPLLCNSEPRLCTNLQEP